ncbi:MULTISPECIES: flagellar basal body L-ring protein FlgH [Halanaerobium]|jgi:flagellar L-ring protein precursor FlgH|uniref:Flagellar L-ring protein n=1 Tax=Halanaerobium kushneri TaxID=56779 RepID=A0A1N6U9T7_9FIRM|nr:MULTISPECIES: flagellar basal body L-ring protein FlgH [Halanaerobium]PUU89139.1 MAG: flagellar L-ring protein precursor FlgH [Halanaerobium sp.]PUU94699.1 MAG: flagellar L-ring protein precursor FlgH [Halanaerobium sp.]RCW60242.1 flagellar L-ring protein precursor FlgH [Halanaerobium sp. ST460_2HS_T2]SIQ62375.1 flagellar L-ring protein precursor FlgH [Halanaerobium kushneri]
MYYLGKFKLISIVLIIVFLATSAAAAESLWSDNSKGLYQDYPEYEMGDIITVVIEEDASAIQSANSDASQGSDYNAEGSGFLDFLPFFDFSYSDSESADGQTQRSGTLEADITTEVVELRENGNLKIQGTKRVKINGEIQTIILEGVIRPQDINFDNEVSSKRVSNANIEYEGEGVVGDKQDPGVLTRLFNFIF